MMKLFKQKIPRKFLMLSAITTATILVVVLSLLYAFVWRIPTSREVFHNSQSYVVELKSQTGETVVSYGSAILIDGDGTFISNAHMVAYKQMGVYNEFENYDIRFSFETEYRRVNLIKYDIDKDIAVLKLVDCSNIKLKPAKPYDSSKIKSGDKVYAVGNGMNHGIGISRGIVSIPQVNIEYDEKIRGVIQCDLTINEGNSGGALLDERGRLIGITTFRIKDNLGVPIYGVAFCIPINVVMNYTNGN
jgi:S1-C subfamily serine protease